MKIYIYDVSELSQKDIEKYYYQLPEWRREKIDKSSMFDDKLRSLGASLVLDYALKKEGIHLAECDIEYGKNGKPYIMGNVSLYFNISHSGTKVAVGIHNSEVGIDIQKIRPVNMRLVDRFFTGGEDEYINFNMQKFHEVWCLKESYLKCIGTGLTIGLSEFEIIPGRKMYIDDYQLTLENVDDYKLGICAKNNYEIKIEYLNNIKF